MSKAAQLSQLAARGALWQYGSFAASKLFVFISTVILARYFLDPHDFGFFAMALILINIMDRLDGLGISHAMIYHRSNSKDTMNVALILSFVFNALLMFTVIAAAPLVARFFIHSDNQASLETLTIMIRVLAAGFFITNLKSIPEAHFRKNLQFKRNFLPEVGRSIAKGATAIAMAAAGYGVWSLIGAQIVSGLVVSVLYWNAVRWMPRFYWDPVNARQLMTYGLRFVPIAFLGVLLNHLDYIIIGNRMDETQLGFYTIAYRLPELIIMNFCIVFSQVLFPAYATIQNDAAAQKRGYLTTMRYTTILAFPAGVGIFLIAPDFVHMFYGHTWTATIPVMKIVALTAVIAAMDSNDSDIYRAVNRLDIIYRIWMIQLPLVAVVLWFTANISITAVAAGLLCTTLVMTCLKLWLIKGFLHLYFHEIFAALRPAVIATLVLFVSVLLLRYLLQDTGMVLRLALTTLCGVLAYALTLRFVDRSIYDHLRLHLGLNNV